LKAFNALLGARGRKKKKKDSARETLWFLNFETGNGLEDISKPTARTIKRSMISGMGGKKGGQRGKGKGVNEKKKSRSALLPGPGAEKI